MPRIAVIGHVQHVTLAAVPALPARGDILHLGETRWIPGGGGGMAFFQLVQSPAEVHLFTAVGNDSTADAVVTRLRATGAHIHTAVRDQPHARDLVLVTPDRERTILVVDEPLHPHREDALPWNVLDTCDGVFFTAYDPALIQAARAARVLVVTARRAEVLRRAGARADVVVGSARDPREASTLRDYPVAPAALVMTEGADGGRIETAAGTARFAAAPAPPAEGTAYGAGDSFAAALTWFVTAGLDPADACERASRHGAAVLRNPDPLAGQLPLAPP